MKLKTLSLYCALACTTFSLGVAHAADQSTTPLALNNSLQTITIIGNRSNGIDNTLPDVDIISTRNLRDPSIINIGNAMASNPVIGFTYIGDTPQQLLIRGLGENYASLTIDNVTQPQVYNFGPLQGGSRNLVDIENIRQIDIVKGRQSPQQVGGAFAGTVNLRTFNPSDFVNTQKPFYGAVKAGYTSRNDGFMGNVKLAGQSNGLGALLIFTQRHSHDDKNAFKIRPSATTRHNQSSILAKVEKDLDMGQLLFTVDNFSLHSHTVGDDFKPMTQRTRVGLEGNFSQVGGLDLVKSYINWQVYKNLAYSRFTGPLNMKNTNLDLGFDASKTIPADGGLGQKLSFGIKYTHTLFDYTAGPTVMPIGKGQFIPIPKSRITPLLVHNNWAAYLEDQMNFGNGFTATPGIRVEYFKYRTKADALYTQNNPAMMVQKDYPHGHRVNVEPNINFDYQWNPALNTYFSYAYGATQTYNDKLNSILHPATNKPPFFIIPNPKLKPEKSNQFELGLHYVLPQQLEVKVSAFYANIKDVIGYKEIVPPKVKTPTTAAGSGGAPAGASNATANNNAGAGAGGAGAGGAGAGAGTGVAHEKPQYYPGIRIPYNLNKAKRYGAELELGYHLNPNWYLHSAVAWMKGTNFTGGSSHGVILPSSTPFTAMFGVDYQQDQLWGASVNWKLVGKGSNVEKGQFRTPGYGTVDLTAWVQPVQGLTVTAGAYNLTNKKYWLASKDNGQSLMNYFVKPPVPNDFRLDTQPGRNFAITVQYAY